MDARFQRCENTESLLDYQHQQGLPEQPIEACSTRRNRVIQLASLLLSGKDFIQRNERWHFEHVIEELINHALFSSCLLKLIAGDEKPLSDLTIRVARHLASSILEIDPTEIGIFI